MGLNIRLHNINLVNSFTVAYRKDTSIGVYTPYGTFSGGTTTVSIDDNLEFDTPYFVKITDTVTGLFAIEKIYTHDSKYFECYDQIDFMIDGDPCLCSGYSYSLIDKIEPHGNHSSVISGNTNAYRIYSGTTYDILDATFITTAVTDPSTNVIFTFTGNTTGATLIYFFVEHGDGNLEMGLYDPKKQGGFEVKPICICCAPPVYCCPVGYTLNNGICEAEIPPLSGVSGTTYAITSGNSSYYYVQRGTIFYEDVTNKTMPLTFKNNNIFVPSTSGLTVQPGDTSLLVDGSNWTPSDVAAYFGYNDSNKSGTPITKLTTISTTGVWRENPAGAHPPYDAVMNLRGVQVNSGVALNQWVGVTRCLTVPTTQQYHMILGGDDLFALKIDGEWLLKRVNNNIFGAGGTGTGGQPNRSIAADGVLDFSTGSVREIETQWSHCIPITLSAGTHYFEYFFSDVYGLPTSGLFEVYSGVTTVQLTGFTTYGQVSPYVAVSARHTVGTTQTLIGTYGSNYGIFCEPNSTLMGICDTPYCLTRTGATHCP